VRGQPRPSCLLFLAVLGSGCGSVEEAPPGLTLEIEGTVAVSEKYLRGELEEEIREAYATGLRKSAVDDLAFEVERVYRSRGFAFVETEYEVSSGRGVVKVREGPRVLVEEVRFQGNESIPSRDLDDLLRSPRAGLLGLLGRRVYIEKDVAALQGAVEDAYFDRGFPDARVKQPVTRFVDERRGAVIGVELSEGPQQILEEIDLSGVPEEEREELSKRFEHLIGSAYVPRLRYEVTSGVEERFSELGHPDARAEALEVRGAPSGGGRRVPVALKVQAVRGPAARVRNIMVRGAVETDPDYVKSRVLLKEGDLWDGAAARKSFRRLFGTGLFRSVSVRLEPRDPDLAESALEDRDLLIEVEEGPSIETFFEVGFGSYDLLRGKIGVREKNLFGTGLIGRAEVLGSIRGIQGTLGVTDPWFLRSEWSADLPVTLLHREEPSFTIDEAKVGLRLTRPILEHLVGGAAYRFSLSRVDELEVDDPAEEDPDLRLGALGPFLDLDTRDDLFVPSGGVRARVFGEVGGPYLGGEIHFLHGGISGSHYVQLGEGTVLAGTASTEWIVPIAATDLIPIQERLFSGGENTVRSFQQSELGPREEDGDPLGGEVKNLLSAELRQRIVGELGAAFFVDYGNVARRASKPFRDFRPAVGIGLRYNLPIGPVRVDVGFNPARRDDEDLVVVHVAVGMPY
jgi:outer membrane protein insertion porin family